MTTAAVIGAGDLGGAVAHALASRESVDRVVLVDERETIAAGKALDIQQAGAIAGFHTRLFGTKDPDRIIGSHICIVADRASSPAQEWRDDEGLAYLRAIAPFIGDAPVVFAGVSQARLMEMAVREAGSRPDRVVGSSTEAFAGALKAIVAIEARCAATEVMLTVLGTPPAGLVVPWSEASIGGYALHAVLSTVQIRRIEARAERLWPPQSQALGAAAALVTEGIVRSARRAFSVLTTLDGQFGVRGRVAALPVMLSSSGIVARREPTLSARERVRLESSLGAGFA